MAQNDTSLNSIIDAADLLSRDVSNDTAWLQAVQVAQNQGYTALNVAEFHAASGAVNFFRSSMNEDWLMDYTQQGFVHIDPLILGGVQGQRSLRMTDGKVQGVKQHCESSRDYQDQIVSWGYRNLDTHIFTSGSPEYVKGVVMARADVEPRPGNDHRIISAMISALVHSPEDATSPGFTNIGSNPLTARETDVLSYLASGLRNDAIAYKLGVAEVTVRAHITTAREKLRAATREEAIATAIRNNFLRL
ncbi:MAG: LuxR C-terminal-related transcriptional regulator [Epibacterium sp.]|nr:LuxR C-terminal-related transcriptional regulator [Epibacterium sp.]NQX75670.1 response regulator transcription factor [Epibacterium sp.]